MRLTAAAAADTYGVSVSAQIIRDSMLPTGVASCDTVETEQNWNMPQICYGFSPFYLVEIEICRRGRTSVRSASGGGYTACGILKIHLKKSHLSFNHELRECMVIPATQVSCSFSVQILPAERQNSVDSFEVNLIKNHTYPLIRVRISA